MLFLSFVYYMLWYLLHSHHWVIGGVYFVSLLSVVAHPFLFFSFSLYIYVGPTGGTWICSSPTIILGRVVILFYYFTFCRHVCHSHLLTYRLMLLWLFSWKWLATDLCGGNGFQLCCYLFLSLFRRMFIWRQPGICGSASIYVHVSVCMFSLFNLYCRVCFP